MFNAAPFNTASFNATAEAVEPPYWPVSLSLDVVKATATPEFPLSLAVTGEVTPEFPLSLAVVDQVAITESDAHLWSRLLTVSGIDLSARLIGSSSVDAEAGASAVAVVTLALSSGVFDYSAWTGAAVLMDYVWTSTDGLTVFTLRQFTGQVDSFTIDLVRKTITLTCSDRRKGLMLGSSKDQIAAMLPGSLWSDAYFDSDVDALRYAEDRISTLAADFDLAADGTPRLTDWAAKASADWNITRILDGSLFISFNRHTDLIQQIEIKLDYRFTRLRMREARFYYRFDFMDMVNDLVGMPYSSLVTNAAENTGWYLLSAPIYTRPPAWFDVPPSPTIYLCDPVNGVVEAHIRLGKRFCQSVEEHFLMTLACSSATVDTRQRATISGALESPYDCAAWEADPVVAPALADPGWSVETAQDATTDPDTGRDAVELAAQCGLAMAARKILQSHRNNEVSFSVPLNPFIDCRHTVHIAQPGLSATGKVRRVQHEMDPDDGRAITRVTLAISRPYLTNPAASSAFTPPDAFDIPGPSEIVSETYYINAATHIGGKSDSPVFDETWSGWIINVPEDMTSSGGRTISRGDAYGDDPSHLWADTSDAEPEEEVTTINPAYISAKAYSVQFRLVPPEIESAARDNLDVDIPADYLLRIPEDEFTLTI